MALSSLCPRRSWGGFTLPSGRSLTHTLTGRGERMRASGPVERDVRRAACGRDRNWFLPHEPRTSWIFTASVNTGIEEKKYSASVSRRLNSASQPSASSLATAPRPATKRAIILATQ